MRYYLQYFIIVYLAKKYLSFAEEQMSTTNEGSAEIKGASLIDLYNTHQRSIPVKHDVAMIYKSTRRISKQMRTTTSPPPGRITVSCNPFALHGLPFTDTT
jgi:hypothetical protein